MGGWTPIPKKDKATDNNEGSETNGKEKETRPKMMAQGERHSSTYDHGHDQQLNNDAICVPVANQASRENKQGPQTHNTAEKADF